MKVRHGNSYIQVPHPVWACRLNLYPRHDPRYRLLLHYYLRSLPEPPETKEVEEGTGVGNLGGGEGKEGRDPTCGIREVIVL